MTKCNRKQCTNMTENGKKYCNDHRIKMNKCPHGVQKNLCQRCDGMCKHGRDKKECERCIRPLR